MKKLFIATATLLFMCVAFTQQSNAQTEKPIYLGSSFNYSPEFESSALQINALFKIYDRISIAPNFVHYFSKPPEHIDSATGLNINAHYNLMDDSNITPYALAGMHFSKIDYKNTNVTATDYALNAGLGAKYPVNNILVFGEAKYMIQSYNKFVFGLGLQYQIR